MNAEHFEAPESYTVEETAEILQLTPGRVRQLLRDEDLDGVPPTPGSGQRGWKVSAASVRERQSKQQPRAEQPPPGDRGELVEELRDQVKYLRGQLEAERDARYRADEIIARLSQATTEQARTIRELEAPAHDPNRQPQEAESAGDASSKGPVPHDRETATEQEQPRPWWRRVFGG